MLGDAGSCAIARFDLALQHQILKRKRNGQKQLQIIKSTIHICITDN